MKEKIKSVAKFIKYLAIIGILVGGVAFASRSKEVRKFFTSINLPSVGGAYRTHHKPVEGWYYSVEAVSTESSSGKTFIIGKNVRPEIGGTISENGDLREIEIPKKKVGTTVIRKGSYFIVRQVDKVQTAVFFPDARTVVIDALQN